jgi:hypothetical protein
LFKTRLINIAHGGQIYIRLILEIVNVLATDQSEADESDLYAFVRAENALVGRRGQRRQTNCASPSHRIHNVYRNLFICWHKGGGKLLGTSFRLSTLLP